MKVIVCLDDALGMMFNRRRQSRDKKVIEDMCSTTNTLRIASFSESLFRGMSVGLTVDEQFLEQADCESVCFLENQSLLPHIHKVDQIVVYKWNRRYPADVWFDVPLEEWCLMEKEEFEGNSHDKITKEVYVRK